MTKKELALENARLRRRIKKLRAELEEANNKPPVMMPCPINQPPVYNPQPWTPPTPFPWYSPTVTYTAYTA